MGIITGWVAGTNPPELGLLTRLSEASLRSGGASVGAIADGAVFARVGYENEPSGAGTVQQSAEDLCVLDGYVWRLASNGKRTSIGLSEFRELLVRDFPDCLRCIGGEFVAAVWSPKTRRLLILSDPLGVRRAYFARLPDGALLFSSSAAVISRHPQVSRAPNRENIALTLCALPISVGSTHFAHVSALPPGHALIFADGEVAIQRYFDLSVDDDRRDLEYIAADYRDRFIASMQWQAQIAEDIGVPLSGGLDSSSVLRSLAMHSEHPERILAVSVKVPDEPECTEGGYASIASADIGVRYESIDVTWDIDWDGIFATSDGPETISWVPFLSNACEYCRMCGSARVLLGCMGDLVGGMDFAAIATLFSQGAFGRLFKEFLYPQRPWMPFAARTAMRALLDNAAWKTESGRSRLTLKLEADAAGSGVGVPPWISEAVVKEFYLRDRWHEVLTRRYRAASPAHLRFGEVLPQAYRELAVATHCSRFAGVEFGAPFTDRRLVALSACLPIPARIHRGVSRQVHREAMKGILPEAIRTRTSKGRFDGYFRKTRAYWHASALSCAANTEDWVEPKRLREFQDEDARTLWGRGLADLGIVSGWLLRQC